MTNDDPTKITVELTCGHTHETSSLSKPDPGEVIYCSKCIWNSRVARPAAPAPRQEGPPQPVQRAVTEGDQMTNETSVNNGESGALHIRLVCWDHHHVQAISALALRSIVIAPICTSPSARGDICGSPIWAVEHDGEPTRYVGRPPHSDWERWADCIAVDIGGGQSDG